MFGHRRRQQWRSRNGRLMARRDGEDMEKTGTKRRRLELSSPARLGGRRIVLVARPGQLDRLSSNETEGSMRTPAFQIAHSASTSELDAHYVRVPGRRSGLVLALVGLLAGAALLLAEAPVAGAQVINHPPSTTDDAYSTNVGTSLTVAAPGVLTNDSDPDGDALTAMLESGPARGTLTLNADGSFSYAPAPGFTGAESFTYRAADGNGAVSAVTTVTITVLPVDGDNDGIPDTQDPDRVAAVVSPLPDSAFANGEHRQPMLNRLDAIEQLIASGEFASARAELQSLRRKVDGCGAAADTNDWIVDCDAQRQVRAVIDDLLAQLVSP
ncbi:MAG: cadherin-like domain-containing protein [Jiangellaceae bacterium]|nr:cadherin-like domain-containing protein [Jiangellaceae bacterium]